VVRTIDLTGEEYLNFLANTLDEHSLENIPRSNEILMAGKALETVNCCAFLKRRLIGTC
jgi:hypothetical protein